MPFLKSLKTFKPAWHDWVEKSNKNGLRCTIYNINGNKYIGEWKNNRYNGYGIHEWKSGPKYEGEWKGGCREGYGVITVPYKKDFRRIYTGDWKHDKRHGYGEQWYSLDTHYEGEWCGGMREGWGRMIYADGTLYEGEWLRDKRHGQGILRKPNLDRYEGSWKNDMKHGPGHYFFVDLGQYYEGIWLKDLPRTGKMLDAGRETAVRPPKYPIPPLQVLYPEQIIRKARMDLMELPEYIE